MSRRIFKHTLPPGRTTLTGIVKVLGVGWQGDELRLWAETDPGDSTATVLYAAITGDEPPADAEHVGTAVGAVYVAHVYRQVPR